MVVVAAAISASFSPAALCQHRGTYYVLFGRPPHASRRDVKEEKVKLPGRWVKGPLERFSDKRRGSPPKKGGIAFSAVKMREVLAGL